MSPIQGLRSPGAGQPIPVETTDRISSTIATAAKKQSRGHKRLIQRSLFQYATAESRLYLGRSKRSQDYHSSTFDNIPWGDLHISCAAAKEAGYFRILSHNVNGLSKANSHADVIDFARAVNDKYIGLFGI